MLNKKDEKNIGIDERQVSSKSVSEMEIAIDMSSLVESDVIEQPLHSMRTIGDIIKSKTPLFVVASLCVTGTFIAIMFSRTMVVVLTGVSLIARMSYSILKTRKYHNTNQQADKINRDLAIEIQLERKELSSQQNYVTALTVLNSTCMVMQGASAALLAYYTKAQEDQEKHTDWALYSGAALGILSTAAYFVAHIAVNSQLRQRAEELSIERYSFFSRKTINLEEKIDRLEDWLPD